MNKDEELIFGEIEKVELQSEALETMAKSIKSMSEEELDGETYDDFFMDYETYEEME